MVDSGDIGDSARVPWWPWRRVPWPILVAFEMAGLVVLGVTYAVTKSSKDQYIALVAYSLCIGAFMQWCFRRRVRVIHDDATPLPMLAKIQSVTFLIVWAAVVVFAMKPVLRSTVGPWFAWWLAIVPAIEFDRVLKRHDFQRRVRGRKASAGLPPASSI